MITNPNTLGLWDEHIEEIVDAVHEAGGLVYNDGANFNAILGIARPGDLGIDIMHFNLHKTFSTPHGGGGPGSGPVGVRAGSGEVPARAARAARRRRTATSGTSWSSRRRRIGRLHAFHGNFGMLVRAYTYIRMHGAAGLRQVSEDAVLNANYSAGQPARSLRSALTTAPACTSSSSPPPGRRRSGVRTLDIAKRLLDFGVHPPTVYFPLIVPEALMIEPTETESKESLDHFIGAMLQIARRGRRDAGGGAAGAAHHRVQAARRGGRQPQPQPALAARARVEAKEREREAVAAAD